MVLLSNLNDNWSLVTTITKDLSSSRIVNLGRKFDSTALIVRVDTTDKRDTWYYGGKIWASSLVLGKQAKLYQTDLDLFEQELLIIPQYFAGKYSLLYEAPKYFTRVTLKVWQYNETITNSVELEQIINTLNSQTENLDLIQNNLTSIVENLPQPIDTNAIVNDVNQGVSLIQSEYSDRIAQQLTQLTNAVNNLLPPEQQIQLNGGSNNQANAIYEFI